MHWLRAQGCTLNAVETSSWCAALRAFFSFRLLLRDLYSRCSAAPEQLTGLKSAVMLCR